jgi:2-hydroxychromene-2-carboxylate isomerase
MMDDDVELYFDLGSPYAYLSVARAESVLGFAPALRPVLLGAIFQARGYGSWARTAQRAPRVADLEARAARHGLPLRWPDGWPLDGLTAMRACVWADTYGALPRFARAVLHHAFGRGEDASTVAALTRIADEVGLPGDELPRAVEAPALKRRLRELTDAAWARGVRGIPTFAVGDVVVYGDDQLEQVPLLLGSGNA